MHDRSFDEDSLMCNYELITTNTATLQAPQLLELPVLAQGYKLLPLQTGDTNFVIWSFPISKTSELNESCVCGDKEGVTGKAYVHFM